MIDGILLWKIYSYRNEPVIPVKQRTDGKFACYYPLRSFRYEWVDVDKSELIRMDEPIPDQSKTLAEHLAAARDKRNPEKLREHADRIRRLPRKVKPCNCGRTDGTHDYKCPVYFRQLRQDKKETGQ